MSGPSRSAGGARVALSAPADLPAYDPSMATLENHEERPGDEELEAVLTLIRSDLTMTKTLYNHQHVPLVEAYGFLARSLSTSAALCRTLAVYAPEE